MYVEALVSLQCRVNEKPEPVTHPTRERKQVHHMWDCKTGNIPECDWNWRFETAKTILCSGTLPDDTTYYDAVIGGDWDCDNRVVVNEDKFNER